MHAQPKILRISMILGLSIAWLCTDSFGIENTRLWPIQKTPTGIVSIDSLSFSKDTLGTRPINMGDDAFLAQSLAGLAAKAVNEGRGDELVYVDLWDNESYHNWRRLLLRRTELEDRGYATVWDLAARYHKQGIVSGYILYSNQESSDNVDSEFPKSSMQEERQKAGALKNSKPV